MSARRKPLFSIGPDSDLAPPIRAFRTLLVLAQRLHNLMDDRLRGDGLTTRQAALITAVLDLGQPSLSEVATALRTTHQNVAQLVAALHRKGLLRTEPDPADRRRTRLVATIDNQRYWRERDDADHAAVAGWFAVLSDEELETLCGLADRVLSALDGPGERPDRYSAATP